MLEYSNLQPGSSLLFANIFKYVKTLCEVLEHVLLSSNVLCLSVIPLYIFAYVIHAQINRFMLFCFLCISKHIKHIHIYITPRSSSLQVTNE